MNLPVLFISFITKNRPWRKDLPSTSRNLAKLKYTAGWTREGQGCRRIPRSFRTRLCTASFRCAPLPGGFATATARRSRLSTHGWHGVHKCAAAGRRLLLLPGPPAGLLLGCARRASCLRAVLLPRGWHDGPATPSGSLPAAVSPIAPGVVGATECRVRGTARARAAGIWSPGWLPLRQVFSATLSRELALPTSVRARAVV